MLSRKGDLWQFKEQYWYIVSLRPSYLVSLTNGDVVVNFLFQLIFVFPLFWGMVMYANEFKTKEKQKLTEIKN